MSRLRLKPGFLVIAAVGAVVLVNALAFKGRLTDPVISGVAYPVKYAWNKLTFLRAFGKNITDWRRLSRQVDQFREENSQLLGRLASQENVERENASLREALHLPPRLTSTFSEAGIFNIVFGPEGYRALLNKGESDGVKVGSVVVTSQGSLVGSVEEVMPHTSRVRLVQDRGFEITIGIIGRPTVGISKGLGDQGLALELVAQGDAIAEGDTVISSGADRYPGGLVLGTVSHVVENETSLFKDVRVTPAFRNPLPMNVFFVR